MSANADFVYSRSYRGKVKALVLDWSGTTADAYVLAPEQMRGALAAIKAALKDMAVTNCAPAAA